MKHLIIKAMDAIIVILSVVALAVGWRVGNVPGLIFALFGVVMTTAVWCALSACADELARIRKVLEGKKWN